MSDFAHGGGLKGDPPLLRLSWFGIVVKDDGENADSSLLEDQHEGPELLDLLPIECLPRLLAH